MKDKIIKICLCLGLLASVSCTEFLDEKPQKSILVPTTVEDVRSILDLYSVLNANSLVTFLMADDWVTTSQHWENISPWEQNAYLWQKDIFDPTERSSDFMRLHDQIFYANVSLDILDNIAENSDQEINYLKGEALALRARAMFELSCLFLPSPRSNSSAETKIPVNLQADINAPLELLGISEMLSLVKEDMNSAFTLLPEKAELKTRADKTVAKAFLSRIYLYEENWAEALAAAEYVVQKGEDLLDYSEMDSTKAYPFSLFNEETVFYSMTSSFTVTASPATFVSDDLYQRYEDRDLRKKLFFTLNTEGRANFKGSYTGDFNLFTGLSLSEIYLNGAEAAVRLGKVPEGLSYLNQLGKNRYMDFEEWKDLSDESALESVLAERRKELVFRGTRWMDMKRLSSSLAEFRVERSINGMIYSLSEEEQFTLGIPPLEIELMGQ